MPDDPLLQKAIDILNNDKRRRPITLVDDAKRFLEGFDDFMDVKDADLEAIAQAALRQRNAPPPVQHHGAGGHRGPSSVKQRDPPSPEQLTAPYRFVAIDDHVVPAQDETRIASWGFPIAGGFSGTLDVEWAFETPMLIGVEDDKGVSGPMKLGDDYVIPGASLRGAMRAAMGIVCRARLTQVNANHRYGVRDFTHPLFKEGAGGQRLAWDRLGAGWLRKNELTQEEKLQQAHARDDEKLSDYVLTPCDKRIVRIRALPRSFNHGGVTDNGVWHRDWLATKLGERYDKAGYVKERRGKTLIFDFEDAAKTTSFMRDPLPKADDRTATDYVKPGAGADKGWFVFSSNSPSLKNIDPRTLDEQQKSPRQGDQKKREYVFFNRDGATEIRLTQEAFERFERINSKPGKTKLKPDGSYAVMWPTLDKGLRIPVFYVGDPDPGRDDPDFAMGLTRLFKLPHVNSVGDVLARQGEHKLVFRETPDQKRIFEQPDMVEALFGHVYDHADFDIPTTDDLPEGAARKGRVAFGFATLQNKEDEALTGVITTTAMAPRASYAPFYLRGPIKDWTDEATNRRKGDARLAGRKRYFPRFPAARLADAAKAIETTLFERKSQVESKDTESQLRLLKPKKPGDELRFTGTIRLHNVTAEEVGALLWTLTHGGDTTKPYRHMIGRAKNAGAGQARVKSVLLKLEAHPGKDARKALLDEPPAPWETQGEDGGWLARGGRSLAPFLRAFERYMKDKADKNWPQTDDIREFLGASDPAEGAKLKADFLPTPNDFGRLRRLVKADTQSDPVPVIKVNDRLLPAPKVEVIVGSYGANDFSRAPKRA